MKKAKESSRPGDEALANAQLYSAQYLGTFCAVHNVSLTSFTPTALLL